MYFSELIMLLEDQQLYTAGTIAALAIERELTFPKARNPTRVNLRHSLCLLARTAAFPREGDGFVHQAGLAVAPGWYGWRWKEAVRTARARRQPPGRRPRQDSPTSTEEPESGP